MVHVASAFTFSRHVAYANRSPGTIRYYRVAGSALRSGPLRSNVMYPPCQFNGHCANDGRIEQSRLAV